MKKIILLILSISYFCSSIMATDIYDDFKILLLEEIDVKIKKHKYDWYVNEPAYELVDIFDLQNWKMVNSDMKPKYEFKDSIGLYFVRERCTSDLFYDFILFKDGNNFNLHEILYRKGFSQCIHELSQFMNKYNNKYSDEEYQKVITKLLYPYGRKMWRMGNYPIKESDLLDIYIKYDKSDGPPYYYLKPEIENIVQKIEIWLSNNIYVKNEKDSTSKSGFKLKNLLTNEFISPENLMAHKIGVYKIYQNDTINKYNFYIIQEDNKLKIFYNDTDRNLEKFMRKFTDYTDKYPEFFTPEIYKRIVEDMLKPYTIEFNKNPIPAKRKLKYIKVYF